MNVYDFDKTIFYPDCTLDFIRWCIHRRPAYAGKWLPKVSLYAILYTIGLLKREEAERQMLKFFKYVENPENEVREYWESHRFQMSPWYLLQKKSDDLIISASPEFIVKPMSVSYVQSNESGTNAFPFQYPITFVVRQKGHFTHKTL